MCGSVVEGNLPAWGVYHPSTDIWRVRGGEQASAGAETITDEELSLDEKVRRAMKKLGLTPPPPLEEAEEVVGSDKSCEGDVCPMPESPSSLEEPTDEMKRKRERLQESPHVVAERIASEMGVNKELALAALGATGEEEPGKGRKMDEEAARSLIQQELDIIAGIPEDSNDVHQLVSEGNDVFLSRRALAFAEGNMEDARAILEADKMDAEEEKKAEEEYISSAAAQVRAQLKEETREKTQSMPGMKSLNVDANFDPTSGNLSGSMQSSTSQPPPAKKADVVFEATAAKIQELVLESPVPVLLDAYAPWCGPCKALTPILEEMAVKAGGAFRLVKLNTDNERAIATALEVTALPTVFAVRDGKVLNSFQGMPSGEEMMKSFMMGLLMPGAGFDPPLTMEDKAKYVGLSSKLVKTASAAGFSFSARERLQTRTAERLGDLVEAYKGDMAGAEESAKVVRSLLSHVIRDPYDMKYRKVNLQNKVISSKISAYPPCLAILKSVGFQVEEDDDSLMVGKDKKVLNVSPFIVARDCVDKWIDKNRHAIAANARRHKDEAERARLLEEGAQNGDEDEAIEEDDIDLDAAIIKVRLEGKKKVYELEMRADDSLSMIIEEIPSLEKTDDYQITCAARKLTVKSDENDVLARSLRDLGLTPAASLVIKVRSSDSEKLPSTPLSLKERVANHKSKKKGSHTMQSVGIYGKDDGAKGELIDGGGGVLFEHDVTDDEDEGGENSATRKDNEN
jgi:thioredoxin